MPTIQDIPAPMLALENKDQFRTWLKDLPIELVLKQELMLIWNTALGQQHKADDFQHIATVMNAPDASP